METVRYTYRLRPGKRASRFLFHEGECTRWVWNRCVEMLAASGEWPRGRDLTKWRSELEWLRIGSSVSQQQEMRSFSAKRAVGHGKRRFKSSKNYRPSLEYTVNGFKVRGRNLILPRGISIPIVLSRSLPSEPSSVRVFKDNLGHWYASFVVRRDIVPLPATGKHIGVDWGIKQIATTTEESLDFKHHSLIHKSCKSLAKKHRTMSRRSPSPGKRASSGYRQAKLAVARLQRKTKNQRKDLANKWAIQIVRQCDKIAIEDFKPAFLMKSTMAKKASDAAIGQCKRRLIECAVKHGREVRLVNPAYTTMACSSCNAIAKQRLELSNRQFECEACGHTEDRDKNAAKVILTRAGFNPANADEVRHDELLL